ncbi:MAG: aminoacetone oxidase family FAD-binding enzyme, partial [Opitutaceae bacterium]
MAPRRMLIAGGGAAGLFAAIACAEAAPEARVSVCEATGRLLAKVRISGGGRCNVTTGCSDPRRLVENYPRGARELLGPLTRFGPRETAAWFESRGVRLKTEPDGRVFPVTDSSETVIGCLMRAAAAAGVDIRTGCAVRAARRSATGGFEATLGDGCEMTAGRLLLATGGTKGSAGAAIAEALGHATEPPVPSLFSFHVSDPRLAGLAGVSVPEAETEVSGSRLRTRGPILITHAGLSGPAILRLSAWGARELHARDYRFALRVNWAAPLDRARARGRLAAERAAHP